MLRVESVGYEIDKRPLLRDVSFSIRSGEMVAILGANGAGKSTLMRLLSGEREPSSGKVLLHGKELAQYSKKELSGKRAMLHQQNTISMAFTVDEVVMMGRYGHHKVMSLEGHRKVVLETMEICGVSHLQERSMLTLSGGERQRVHLARVLAQVWDSKQGLLLLDEPVNNLDIQYQHQTLAIVTALARKGFMVITVLHDISLAAQYASRILMLNGGRKWWDGQPTEVLTPTHIYSAFGINARTYTDGESLKTHIVPQEVCLDADLFNSHL